MPELTRAVALLIMVLLLDPTTDETEAKEELAALGELLLRRSRAMADYHTSTRGQAALESRGQRIKRFEDANNPEASRGDDSERGGHGTVRSDPGTGSGAVAVGSGSDGD